MPSPGASPRGAGLYVHVPFCARACPYCDFDFVVGRNVDVAAYLHGLSAEVESREDLAATARLETLYIGGGTPSLLGPAGLRALFGWIDSRFERSGVVETTVELNPEHVDDALLSALREAGVDRVSVGLQSLHPAGLVMLGRAHDAANGRAALRSCVEAGFRTSADLIVGWPHQPVDALPSELQAILETGVEHVSVYALTVEDGTPWTALVARGKRALPDPDRQADALLCAQEVLIASGLQHYEIASYARPGARSRHNEAYWTWRDYVGLGPSAASARYAPSGAVERRTNARGLATWSADPAGGAQIDAPDPVGAAVEGLWLGLRRLDGIDVEAYLTRFPAVDRAWLEARVLPAAGRGDLLWSDGRSVLRVAPGRWMWHDDICARLM